MTKTSHSRSTAKAVSYYTAEQESQLVSDNLALVAHLAKKFSPRRQDLQDYIQAGSMGLLRAIRRHDPNLGSITTFAWNPIRWEILSYIERNQRNDEPLDGIQLLYEENDNPLWSYVPDDVSPEEQRIVEWRAEGYSFREIGEKLGGRSRNYASRVYKLAAAKMKDSEYVEEADSVR